MSEANQENEKQVEKKGRFIIQEVIEEKRSSPRVRHGSIKGDSKIFITFQSFEEDDEILENNFCYVYSHSYKLWLNFSEFWNYENSKKKIFKNENDFNKKLFKYREKETEKEKGNIYLNNILSPLKERQLTINIGELETKDIYETNFNNILSPTPKKITNLLQLKKNISNSPRHKISRSNSSKFFFELYNNLKKGNSLFQPSNKDQPRSNSKIHVISNKLLRTSSYVPKFNLNINDFPYTSFTGVGKYNEKFLKIKECHRGEFIENKKKFFHILEINNCMSFSLNIK